MVISHFLGITRAFDFVDHSMLLEKLEWKAIRGITNNLKCKILESHKQKVIVNGCLNNLLKAYLKNCNGYIINTIIVINFSR